jgi:hypothetical protein
MEIGIKLGQNLEDRLRVIFAIPGSPFIILVKILTQRARLWLPLEGGRLPFAPKGGKVELSPWI